LSRRKPAIEEHFDVSSDAEEWEPRFNIAPTQSVPIIRQHPKEPRRDLSRMHWGLVPSWARDASGAAGMINARAETAANLPAYREGFRLRRCLVPADGFYEWQSKGPKKQPFCTVINDDELFAFAGLWDRWRTSDGRWIRSFCILTTTPNTVTSVIHDRMPVILPQEDYDLWLDPGMQNAAVAADLLKPFDPKYMRCYPVSNRVNHVLNDDAECADPIVLESLAQGTLFE